MRRAFFRPALKPRGVRLRACRILLTTERSFSPSASYFLSAATKSNQKTPPRSLRPSSQKKKRDEGCPALRSRSGVHRQAIPGLTLDASASMPRLAPTGASLRRSGFAVLGADNGEERQKRKAKATSTAHNNIKSHSSFPRKRESRGRGDAFRYLTPHPNPLPQGERGLEAGDAWLLMLPCFAFDVPPVTAPSIAARGDRGPRLFGAGRGRMPKRPASGQGWPVAGPRHEREAQGTPKGRSSRVAALFGYFLALLPKSNSPVGENPRVHCAKAERRVMPLDSGFRWNDEMRGMRTPSIRAASRRYSGRTGGVGSGESKAG